MTKCYWKYLWQYLKVCKEIKSEMYIADLHTHSHYAQATSPNLNLETSYQWAQVKGIHLLGTGDFTHPAWFKELQEKLVLEENGFFSLKNKPLLPALEGIKIDAIDTRFCLATEISTVYAYGNKIRKNHNLVYTPDFETAAFINNKLAAYGDLSIDGRPTLSLSSRDLFEIVLESSPHSYLVPAHAWTPWFSTLGSKGGYDSIEECFRDLAPYIFAIETGLSSDPPMNRRCSMLDRITMMSSSDAHSPHKLGREANYLTTEFSYDKLFEAVKSNERFGTYEFYPEEGKYSFDGHRKCGICFSPEQTKEQKGICPVCKRPVTVGVMNRVDQLSDKPVQPADQKGFQYVIPLAEVLSEIHAASPESKKVTRHYIAAINKFGNEFNLLQHAPIAVIQRFDPILATAIHRMRNGHVKRKAGYDGVYGRITLFEDSELHNQTKTQMSMF